MQFKTPSELVGKGIYSLAEAKKLTGVSQDSIKRWMCGYTYPTKNGKKREMLPLWKAELGKYDDESYALTFRDLMEIRFIHAFKQHGVTWPHIRAAAEFAETELKDDHPFSTQKFQTDGKRIFAENADKLDLDTKTFQYALHEVIKPSFVKSIDFVDNKPAIWRPAGNDHIIIDPQRSFGKPILRLSGITTLVIAKSVQTERSVNAVARLFDISVPATKAAVEFENRIAA